MEENKTKAKIIAVAGKGGVGKTSLCSAIVRELVEAFPGKRILAIDADPAVGLSTALGVHVEHTIDDIRNEVIETSERGEYRQAIEVLNEARFRIFDTMVECDGFAFLAIGRPEAAGCYCSVNSYLKEVISMLANDFDYVVIDGEAGIEQISRRVMEQVSHLVLVTDQSAKGVNVCREIKEAADDLITYERIGMIVNRVVDPSMTGWTCSPTSPPIRSTLPTTSTARACSSCRRTPTSWSASTRRCTTWAFFEEGTT